MCSWTHICERAITHASEHWQNTQACRQLMMSSLRRGRAGELPESPKKHRNDSNGERLERETERGEERGGEGRGAQTRAWKRKHDPGIRSSTNRYGERGGSGGVQYEQVHLKGCTTVSRGLISSEYSEMSVRVTKYLCETACASSAACCPGSVCHSIHSHCPSPHYGASCGKTNTNVSVLTDARTEPRTHF